MAISAEEFKNALQCWTTGVSIVTTYSEKFGQQGMTVSAFSSVSVNPPQILVCINQTADTFEGIEESQCFGVSILSANQHTISNQFAGGCSQAERFASNSWHTAQTNAPLLSDALMSLDCKVVQKFLVGSHWILIGEVQASFQSQEKPLLYYRSNYQQLA